MADAKSAQKKGLFSGKRAYLFAAIIIIIVAAAALAVLYHGSNKATATSTLPSTTTPVAVSGNYTVKATTTIPQISNTVNETNSSLYNSTISVNATSANAINMSAINATNGIKITFNRTNGSYVGIGTAANITGLRDGTYNTSFSTDPSTAAGYFPNVAFPTLYGNISIIAGWHLNYSSPSACTTNANCAQFLTVTYVTNNSKALYKDFILYTNTTFDKINATMDGAVYSSASGNFTAGWRGLNLYVWKGDEFGIVGVISNGTINGTLVASSYIHTMNQT
jgi:hypothetical protein